MYRLGGRVWRESQAELREQGEGQEGMGVKQHIEPYGIKNRCEFASRFHAVFVFSIIMIQDV